MWIVDPKDGKKKKIVDLSGFFDEVRRDAEEMKVLVDTGEYDLLSSWFGSVHLRYGSASPWFILFFRARR